MMKRKTQNKQILKNKKVEEELMSDELNNKDQEEQIPVEAVEMEEIESQDTATLEEELSEEGKALKDAQTQAEEYLAGWQRARAELINYKKRVERDQSQIYQDAAGRILKRYLEIVDDFELALKNKPTEGEGAKWAEGIELIYRKLLNILENEGVETIDPKGEPFDPNLHEAITSEDSDEHESGQVIEVLRKGYKLGDRVLRPALVRVAQ